MRVRPPASLDGGKLLRITEITDIENTDSAKTFGAGHRSNSLRPAIDTPARLLDRHEKQIPIDRHITLSTRADHRSNYSRVRLLVDRICRKPGEVPHEEVVVAECDIGLRDINPGIRLRLG